MYFFHHLILESRLTSATVFSRRRLTPTCLQQVITSKSSRASLFIRLHVRGQTEAAAVLQSPNSKPVALQQKPQFIIHTHEGVLPYSEADTIGNVMRRPTIFNELHQIRQYCSFAIVHMIVLLLRYVCAHRVFVGKHFYYKPVSGADASVLLDGLSSLSAIKSYSPIKAATSMCTILAVSVFSVRAEVLVVYPTL